MVGKGMVVEEGVVGRECGWKRVWWFVLPGEAEGGGGG
jgi:hypothetical protein